MRSHVYFIKGNSYSIAVKMLRNLIGVCLLCALMLFVATKSFADAHLEIMPSSTEIGSDENLRVEFKVTVDQLNVNIGEPSYQGNDFEEVNAFGRMSGVESSFINGAVTVKKTSSQTIIFHPKKTGRLTIRNIQVKVGNQMVRAPDLVIDVRPGSGGGGGNSGGLAQNQKQGGRSNQARPSRAEDTRTSFFLKTEPNKTKVYRGEQIVLTYSLYTRTQIQSIQMERYPTVPGFLKEEIDVPVLSGRLSYSRSTMNGLEYNRAVLAQYAIYPVKTGTLTIDPIEGKFAFQAQGRNRFGGNDDEDPFNMLNSFFRAMQVVTEQRASDSVNIEVLPLPTDGQPKDFSGLVGDFEVSATLDKPTVKVGEAINVKVKLSGRGHASSLEKLNVPWPSQFDLYEDKSNTVFQKTGMTERTFDFMIIPKEKGHFQIPAVAVSMFNPSMGYQTRTTRPIDIDVLEGAMGASLPQKVQVPQSVPADATALGENKEPPKAWMAAADATGTVSDGPGVLEWILHGLLATSGLFLLINLLRWRSKLRENLKLTRQQKAKKYLERVRALKDDRSNFLNRLAELSVILSEVLNDRFGIHLGSMTRADLRRYVNEQEKKSISEELLLEIDTLLDKCDQLRFAPESMMREMNSDSKPGDESFINSIFNQFLKLVERIYSAK